MGGKEMNATGNRYHKNGTVTYWSVYQQTWIKRARMIPDRELAAMDEDERRRTEGHLSRREGI
tara:strand:+ start:308 stop:496 length:189 start_codon:yes stop_codon:yes gene_type:complete